MANRWGKGRNSDRFYFPGFQNHCRWWLQPWVKRLFALWKISCDKPRQLIKKQRHHFANKGPSSQSYGFSSSHVWMWELNHKVDWTPKIWCFQIMVLERTLESPLDIKEIKPVNHKGNQPLFIGRTDTEAEAPILCLPYGKSRLIGKSPRCWEKLKAGGEGGNRG